MGYPFFDNIFKHKISKRNSDAMRRSRRATVIICVVLVIFSMCAENKIETPSPTTTPQVTQTQSPIPTTAPPTTPAPINEERNYCVENGIPENLMQKIIHIDADNKLNPTERLIIDKSKEILDSDIPEKIVGDLLIDTAYRIGGESGIEYLMQNIDTSLFKKMIEDELIENHEIRLIEKSFTYSGLQNQLKVLNDKASENYLKTYKVVLDKSINAKTEPERFLYGKIDEHLPEFKIGEDGFLYYSNGVLKVDDKNLYIKWLTKPYNPIGKERWKIWEKRGCDWQYGFDKEFSLCWSKFIDEETGIPWNTNTKYFSVEPIENNARLFSSGDAALTLDFDIFGFNGLGYKQLLDIYI